MTTGFPATIDALTNPSTGSFLNSPSHGGQHTDANDAIEALETKVGVDGSAVTTSLDYKVANNLGKPMNLTGATAATRFVGGRAGSVPSTGTFIAGDFIVMQSGDIAVCTVGGTPGTWITLKSSVLGMTLPDYVIYKSGSTYFARNTATNVDDASSTNAASVVQSAHDALVGGGLIELKSGITYNATSMVTLSTAGVCVRSRPQTGEDQPTAWLVNSALAAGAAAFRLTGSGAAVGGISVECNANADYGVDLRGAGQNAFDLNTKEAKVACFYVDGPAGAQRCTFWNIRSDNGSANGATNIKLDGPDHVAWGLRTSGCANNGYSLWMDTSRCMISSGHITGTSWSAACVFISGDENRLSDFYLDSGPNGENGDAHTVITGSGNYISALVQNAACKTDYSAPAVGGVLGVTGTAFVSGQTYRFTCGQAHLLAVGDAVWLEGFASSNGFFNNTTSGNVLVTNISDSTHFDADLGATTTFTDSVGTAKRICKYGVLLQKGSSTDFVQGNELHLTYQGKGANLNTGEFYYALGILDETGSDPTSLVRFSGNRIHASAGHTTRFSNLEATWGSIAGSDTLIVDLMGYQQDTTTPIPWRTAARGKSSASTGTTWTIPHGLAGSPRFVSVTPAVDPGSGVRWWVSTANATNIIITASASITSAVWYWKAEM
jgi:hypothetical protein